MLLKEFIQELGDRLDVKNIDDGTVRSILARKINEGMKEVGRAHDWDQLKIHGSFNTVGNYTSGTVTITNGSNVVTGANTVWTSAMVGRYFQSASGSNWYRIIAVNSNTQIVLETAIVESTGTPSSYAIWKRFYYLPSNLRKVKIFGRWLSGQRIEQISENSLIDRKVDQSIIGEPCEAIDSGVEPFESSYAAGTGSLTKDSNVMTGTGTAWLGNVFPGERIVLGGRTFRVKRIESDTSIVMLNYSTSTLTGQTYTIEKDNSIGFQLYPSPDKGYVIPYIGYARVFDMVNEDKDRPPFPEDFDGAILDGAEASRMRDLDDAKWIQKQAEFKGRVIDLKAMMKTSKQRVMQLSPNILSRINI